MSKVMIDPAAYGSVRQSVDRAFELFPLEFKGKKVFIKPNVLRASEADESIVTHPAVLRAVVEKVEHILVSLLVEPDIEIVELSKECGADFIEIHTGKYCNTVDKTGINKEIDRIYTAADHAVKVGIKVSAGHGLTYKNIMPILYARALEEVNIGHSIILRSLSVGLSKAVEEMLDILD
jgi:pyridoxine 5-phosphate synthase